MNKVMNLTYDQAALPSDFSRLPVSWRASAAERKYAAAVAMYATTDLSLRQVAEACNVTPAGLSGHIAKYHRPLLYVRYGLDVNDPATTTLKVKQPKGQSWTTHIKYKEAIEACGDIAYIEYNVSQIARLFNLNPTALTAQLRVHYPDIIPNRESLRQRLAIADNTHRGVRATSTEQYAKAMKMYQETNLTIAEVSERCNVSKSGLTQFLRFYHKEILAHKADRRYSAKISGTSRAGELSGNGSLYGPKSKTVEKYAAALELYRSTSMTIAEIVDETGVPEAGFRNYLTQWCKADKMRHRGYECDPTSDPDLSRTRRYLKSTASKYAPAIENLRENPRPIAEVAAQFGFNPDIFREYLKTHEPDLAAKQGMMRGSDGRLVKTASREKYSAAIQEYATSAENLKDIARRHGLVYNSLLGYVLRNCRQEREQHRRLVEAASASLKTKE